MLYEVDFTVRVNETFSTILTAFIHAISVSECMSIAEDMKLELPASKDSEVFIFIAA